MEVIGESNILLNLFPYANVPLFIRYLNLCHSLEFFSTCDASSIRPRSAKPNLCFQFSRGLEFQ